MSGRSSPLIRRFRRTRRYAASGPRPCRLLLLRSLRAVLRPPLSASIDTFRVEGTADDVIAHAGQVLHTTATDEHHRMLLQIVPLTGDVRRHLLQIAEANARHLAEGRIRLLWRHRPDLGADTALLGRPGT